MRESIPPIEARLTAALATDRFQQPLKAELDAAPKANRDAFQIGLDQLLLLKVCIILRFDLVFLAILDKISVIAHIADCRLILEHDYQSCEQSFESPC